MTLLRQALRRTTDISANSNEKQPKTKKRPDLLNGDVKSFLGSHKMIVVFMKNIANHP
jgi:hypothetical protein